MNLELKEDGLHVEGFASPVRFSLAEAQQLRRFLNDWPNVQKLRPGKKWDECSYEGHADDCTCNGMGGDR